MSKRGGLKLKDIKPGTICWEIECCQHNSLPVPEPTRVIIKSKPFDLDIGCFGKTMFAKYTRYWGCNSHDTDFSLHDFHIGVPNTGRFYNMHRLFVTKKAAEKYRARINAGCLTKQEREYLYPYGE